MEKGKIKIAILSFAALLMGASIITGLLAEIANHYSQVDVSIISMVLTLPFLVATVFSLLAGPLSRKISKKILVIFSLCCLLAAAAIAFIFGGVSIYILLLSSALFGVSQGMLSTLSMALIADYYEGQERSSLMGLQSTFVNFGGMVISFFGALLAGIYWLYSYLVILVAIPVLVLVIKYLPKDKPINQVMGSAEEKGKLNSVVYLNVFTAFFYGIFVYVFQANVAFYVNINQLGDATTAGMVNTTLVAFGGLTGIAYGYIRKYLKEYMLPIGIFVTVIGLVQLILIGNLISVFIAAACTGYGLTSLMPTALFNVSMAVKQSLSATAIALVNCAVNVGIFLSPLVLGFLSRSMDGEIKVQFIISAIGLAVISTIYIFGNAKVSKSNEINTN